MGERTRARLAWTAVTVAVLGVLGGCLYALRGPTPMAECSLSLRFEGRTYDAGGHGDHQRLPEKGPVIGTADELGCDAEKIGTSRVRAAAGVPRSQAILYDGYPYLSTGDSVVTEKVPCTGPASFTGRLLYTDHELVSEREPRTGAPPYRAWFEARRGTGLPLEDMRWVIVRADVTAGTTPRPGGRALRRALWGAEKPPVRVATHCRGGRFVADRVVRRTRVPGPS